MVSRAPESHRGHHGRSARRGGGGLAVRIRDVAAQYLPADAPGATQGGAFTSVPTRATASNTPIFRDLAPDVYRATGQLITMVEREAEAVAAGLAGGGADRITGHPW